MAYLISILTISNLVSVLMLAYMATKLKETESKLRVSRRLLELVQAQMKKRNKRRVR